MYLYLRIRIKRLCKLTMYLGENTLIFASKIQLKSNHSILSQFSLLGEFNWKIVGQRPIQKIAPFNLPIHLILAVQSLSEYQTFENRKHSKSGRFEGRNVEWSPIQNPVIFFRCHLKTGPFHIQPNYDNSKSRHFRIWYPHSPTKFIKLTIFCFLNQILGPPKKRDGRDIVKEMFKKAREHGAEAVDPAAMGKGRYKMTSYGHSQMASNMLCISTSFSVLRAPKSWS